MVKKCLLDPKKTQTSTKDIQRNMDLITCVCVIVVVLCMIILPQKIECSHIVIKNITSVLVQLAMAYIAAYIFYRCTVTATERVRHNRQMWFIHDHLTNLNITVRNLLENQHWDRDYNESDAQQNLDKTELTRDCQLIEFKTFQLAFQNWSWTDDDFRLFADAYNCCIEIENLVGNENNIDYKKLSVLFSRMDAISSDIDKSASFHVSQNQ